MSQSVDRSQKAAAHLRGDDACLPEPASTSLPLTEPMLLEKEDRAGLLLAWERAGEVLEFCFSRARTAPQRLERM